MNVQNWRLFQWLNLTEHWLSVFLVGIEVCFVANTVFYSPALFLRQGLNIPNFKSSLNAIHTLVVQESGGVQCSASPHHHRGEVGRVVHTTPPPPVGGAEQVVHTTPPPPSLRCSTPRSQAVQNQLSSQVTSVQYHSSVFRGRTWYYLS